MKSNPRLARIARIVVSLALLLLLVWYADPSQIATALKEAPLVLMIPWATFYEFAVVALWAWGVHRLLGHFHPVGFSRLCGLGLKLQILTLVIPGRLGDISMPLFLRRWISPRDSTIVLLIDKSITLIVITIIGSLGVVHFLGWPLALAMAGSLITGILILSLLLSERSQSLRDRVAKLLLGRFVGHAHGFRRQLLSLLHDWQGIAINLVATMARMLLAGFSLQLVLGWFGTEAPLWYIVMVQVLAQLITIVPISFMGIGVVESVNIALLGRIGIDPAVVLACALAMRALQTIIYLMLFLLLFRNDMAPSQGPVGSGDNDR